MQQGQLYIVPDNIENKRSSASFCHYIAKSWTEMKIKYFSFLHKTAQLSYFYTTHSHKQKLGNIKNLYQDNQLETNMLFTNKVSVCLFGHPSRFVPMFMDLNGK